jgi:hypothetical protein
MKGQPATQTFKISYQTKEDLIKKLEEKLKELKGDTQVTPLKRCNIMQNPPEYFS